MKITKKQTEKIKKHGINISVYPINRKEVGLVYLEVGKGHFEEFYHKKSTFLYYVLAGKGTFYLNGKPVAVKQNDVVVAPPLTRIYYLGKMKMMLVTTPAWTAKNEVHVRDIKQ